MLQSEFSLLFVLFFLGRHQLELLVVAIQFALNGVRALLRILVLSLELANLLLDLAARLFRHHALIAGLDAGLFVLRQLLFALLPVPVAHARVLAHGYSLLARYCS